MQYDPIKKSLGSIFNNSVLLRILFYKLLDMLLLRSWHIRREIKHWAANAGDNEMILDAGAGFGQYIHYLSGLNRNWNILGIDVKDEQVEDCNIFFSKTCHPEKVKFMVADLVTFVNPATYDLILSVDVMEHILEDEKVFENFCISLKSEGVLLISTPSDQGGSDVHHKEDHSFIDEHVRDGYNISDIRIKLQKAGFSDIIAHYSYGKPGKISWKLSMKYPITLLNISKLFFIIIPFYYIITFPFCLLLNWLDLSGNHNTGTGLIVKAIKHGKDIR